jgi:GMP synthase PP-ATPase subunit
MGEWKKIKVFVIKANDKFIDQVHTIEQAEKIAQKYINKGFTVTIKEAEAESMAINFGVI